MTTRPNPEGPDAAATAPGPGRRDEVPLALLLSRAAAELQAQEPPPWRHGAGPLPHRPLAPPMPSAAPSLPPAVPPRRPPWLAWSGAVTWGLVMAGSWWLMLGPARVDPDRTLDSGFLAVAPAERWERLGPLGDQPAWVMTTELPSERLAAFGLPYDPARAAERVRAELLLHPASGEVLAVRLIAQ